MVSNRKKRQSNSRLLSQLDDFDQDITIGNNSSDKQGHAAVNEGTGDRDFFVGTSDDSLTNDNTVNVKTLERCFNEPIDSKLSNFVDTVEDGIQNAILTTIDVFVAPKIELPIRSINACLGRDATSVMANSDHGEQIGITAPPLRFYPKKITPYMC